MSRSSSWQMTRRTPLINCKATACSLLLLLVCAISAQAEVPAPVRDTSFDWRCLHPDGAATNHQRQDTAIVACQNAAESDPGQTYYIEGGRYRVTVTSAPDTTPPTPPAPPDIEYTSTKASADSIHAGVPAGTPIRVWILSGTNVEVKPNGSTQASSDRWSVEWSYLQQNGTWSAKETIEWVL